MGKIWPLPPPKKSTIGYPPCAPVVVEQYYSIIVHTDVFCIVNDGRRGFALTGERTDGAAGSGEQKSSLLLCHQSLPNN